MTDQPSEQVVPETQDAEVSPEAAVAAAQVAMAAAQEALSQAFPDQEAPPADAVDQVAETAGEASQE